MVDPKELLYQRLERVAPLASEQKARVRQYLSEPEVLAWLGEVFRFANELDNVSKIQVPAGASDAEIGSLLKERKAMVQGSRASLQLLLDTVYDEEDKEDGD